MVSYTAAFRSKEKQMDPNVQSAAIIMRQYGDPDVLRLETVSLASLQLEMDPNDQMDQVYEALVHWADAVVIASPIRWGAASSLYFKMAERLNCVQNAITIRNQVLIRNKVAGFIIVGGQDNIQDVAGHMLGFFAELGFIFPLYCTLARLVARRYGTQC
jgi:multimeric flavodoxin WrbA